MSLLDALNNAHVWRVCTALSGSKFRSVCCIPYFVIAIFVILCIAAIGIIIVVTLPTLPFSTESSAPINSTLIALATIVGIVVISNVYSWAKIGVSLCRLPQTHLHKLVAKLDTAHLEGYVSAVKREVELIAQMTQCLDAFLGIQSRLVIIVDGLDSCEQEKLLQVCILFSLFGCY